MKTLKKSLCLVLALVFVLSLCTIGVGAAAFADEAEITPDYKEAVDVMTDLGILVGVGNNKFAPTDNVTRAQAAKMITYMMLGATNAERLPTPASKPFNDVETSFWGAKYISFCATKKVILGYGDGNYGPDDNVTGAQLAKMLLVALGYGEMGEYVGSGWDIFAVTDAFGAGIYEGSLDSVDFGAPATREECALYVYNALTMGNLVAYDVDYNVYDPMYVSKNSDELATYANKVWGLTDYYALITENQATGAKATIGYKLDAKGNFALVDDDDNAIDPDVSLKFETGKEMIGHVAYVLVNAKNGKVYNVSDKSVVYPARFTTYAALAANDVEDSDEAINWVNYIAGEQHGAAAVYDDSTPPVLDHYEAADFADSDLAKSAIMANAIVFNDRVYGYASTSFRIAKVDKIDSKGVVKFDFGNSVTAESNDKWTLNSGIEKGDYVQVEQIGELYYTYPTTTEVAYVSQRTNPDYIFSYTYSYNRGAFAASRATNGAVIPGTNSDAKDYDKGALLTNGKYYTFYLDTNGQYFMVEDYEGESNDSYVFFVASYSKTVTGEYGDGEKNWYAQCVDANGDIQNYLTGVGTTDPIEVDAKNVYELGFNSDGYATLSDASAVILNTGSEEYKNGTKIKNEPYYLNEDCTVITIGNNAPSKYEKAETPKTGKATAGSLSTLATKVTTGTLSGKVASGQIFALYREATNTGAFEVSTIWILGYPTTTTTTVSNSLIYVNNPTANGELFLGEDGNKKFQTYGVYINGEYASLAIKGTVAAGFYEYSTEVVDGETIFVLGDKAKSDTIKLGEDEYVLYRGILNGQTNYDGQSLSGMTFINTSYGAGMSEDVSSTSAIEALYKTGKYDITLNFATKTSSGKTVPTGTIYVVVTEKPATPAP